ncbi:MAG: class I SAM-dependent methyltransferase [Ardenticatenaceae bacterium]|nr:class I SAM-dependent methyltransferase [Ardenticatenaceae bacterium]
MSFIGLDENQNPQVLSSKKLGSIVSNSLILEELINFFKDKAFDTLIDVGCGTKPYEPVYEKSCRRSFGFDVDHSPHNLSKAAFLASAENIPLLSDSADVILCSEVLEHVPEPWQALDEMARIAKPGAWIIITTPFLVSVHEPPYDFYRYTEFGLRHLLNRAGFEVERLVVKNEKIGVFLSQILWFQTKFWWMVTKWTKVKSVYSDGNPFLWLGVVVPQKIYLKLFRKIRDKYPSSIKKLSRSTAGYIVIGRYKQVGD